MKPFGLILVGLGFFLQPAFAIDQVILQDGRTIEGTVLNDVPNRHVDIRLSNGRTQRFQKSEVALVERDVPSSNDRSMLGNQSKAWISILAGGYTSLTNSTSGANSIFFDFGAKIGFNAANLDFGWFACALSYDYVSQSSSTTIFTATQNYHDLNAQLLLTRVGGSGFYVGPNAGIAIFSVGATGLGVGASTSTSYIEAGAQAGYDLFLSPSFSIGPDVRYEHIFTIEGNVLKFALQAGLHF